MKSIFKPIGTFLKNMFELEIVKTEGKSETTTRSQTAAAGAFVREGNESTQAEIYHERINVPDYPLDLDLREQYKRLGVTPDRGTIVYQLGKEPDYDDARYTKKEQAEMKAIDRAWPKPKSSVKHKRMKDNPGNVY